MYFLPKLALMTLPKLSFGDSRQRRQRQSRRGFLWESTNFNEPEVVTQKVNLPQGSWQIATLSKPQRALRGRRFKCLADGLACFIGHHLGPAFFFLEIQRRERDAKALREATEKAEAGGTFSRRIYRNHEP